MSEDKGTKKEVAAPAAPAAAEMDHKPISKALKTFYGVGDFGFGLMSSVETYFFNFFLTNIAQFSLPVVNLIAAVGSIGDAALSWMYGAIINSIKPMKWGRYRSWMIILPWLVPFLYLFQYVKIGDGAISWIIIMVAVIASHVAWNFPWVANISMIAVAGKTPQERAELSSTRMMWSSASAIIFSPLTVALAAFFAGIVGQTNQYAACAFLYGAVMAIAYFAHFKMFDGYEDVEVEAAQADAMEKAEAKVNAKRDKTGGKDLGHSFSEPLIIMLLYAFFGSVYMFAFAGIAVYYFTYVAGNVALFAVYLSASSVFSIIGAYLARKFIKQFSLRTVAIVTSFAMCALLLIARIFFANATIVICILCVNALVGGCRGVCQPALYADLVVYNEWKTGKNAAGWISGLQNVPLKIAICFRAPIITACLAIGGFTIGMDASQVTDSLKSGICLGFMVIPAVLVAITGLLLLFGFRLTTDKVNQYQTEINARKAAEKAAAE